MIQNMVKPRMVSSETSLEDFFVPETWGGSLPVWLFFCLVSFAVMMLYYLIDGRILPFE